jgi:hypothetical protein
MADNRQIVGWFYKNGRRIPIRGKKGEKGYQGKNTKEVLDKVKADRDLEVDSADRRYMAENPRAINGDRVDLIGKNKKMSATFNSYSDGGKELINFRREPDKDMLRKNAKSRHIGEKFNHMTGVYEDKKIKIGPKPERKPKFNHMTGVYEDRGSGITEKNGKFYLKSPVNGTQRIFKTKEAAQNYLRNADAIDSHARGLGRSAEHAGPHTKKKR